MSATDEKPSLLLPRISIRYCPRCGWLLRAAWMAQEILTTFADNVREVALVPEIKTAGVFQICIDDVCIWDRKKEEGFPNITELKQRVRDKVAPGKSLGHSDKKSTTEKKSESKE